LADGQACNGGPVGCLSGLCADGLCCDSTCEQQCYACDVSGHLGSCSPIEANRPDMNTTGEVCDGEYRCDGGGNCKPTSGTCSQHDECALGHCVDGFCCDTPCNDICHACYLEGSEGICSPLPRNTTDTFPADACTGDMACDGSGDGSGACKKGLGSPCTVDTDCASDHCVDHVCCDGPCDLTCESCALLGTEGTCTRIGANLDPDSECLGVDPLCGGVCNGQGACDFPGIGSGCGLCKACDGTGRCVATPLDDNDCGVIDCDGLDGLCRDYHDRRANRCLGFGTCKTDNDPVTCTSFGDVYCSDAGAPVDAGVDGPPVAGLDHTSADGPRADGPADGPADGLADGWGRSDGQPSGDRPNSLSGSGGCGIGAQGAGSPWILLLLWLSLFAIRKRRPSDTR
jgi:hypothetical protein